MNILFLSESHGWSGGAAQLLALGRGLAGKGHRLTLASHPQGEVAGRWRASGLEHLPLYPRQDYDVLTAWRLARWMESTGVHVLHAHHPRAHAVGLLASYFSRRRPVLVVTRRVSFKVSGNLFSRFKYANPRIDGYVAVAESVRQELIRGGVDAGSVRTIPSGVDPSRFSPRPRDEGLARELDFPADAPVIGKIANYGPWKGQDIFFKAAVLLLRRHRAFFFLAGRDTDSLAAREAARTAGLPDGAVRFLGFRRDIERLLSLTDISVNAALSGEGISGALRESLAMGVPVLASDAGGNPELVREGETGRLFGAGDFEALARLMAECLDDPLSTKRLAEAGRATVLARFSVGAMVGRTATYYEELLARRAAR